MTRKTLDAYKKGAAVLGILINVVVLSGLLLVLVAGCAGTFSPKAPCPPRGRYTLSQAQRWVEKKRTPRVQNRGYYQVKPR